MFDKILDASGYPRPPQAKRFPFQGIRKANMWIIYLQFSHLLKLNWNLGLGGKIGTFLGPFLHFGPIWDQVPNSGPYRSAWLYHILAWLMNQHDVNSNVRIFITGALWFYEWLPRPFDITFDITNWALHLFDVTLNTELIVVSILIKHSSNVQYLDSIAVSLFAKAIAEQTISW